jgi:hypothetical protein
MHIADFSYQIAVEDGQVGNLFVAWNIVEPICLIRKDAGSGLFYVSVSQWNFDLSIILIHYLRK